ncbi:MAG: hypothetical protein IJ286_05625, partial [Alistipes sp.]|nr:hypothetical protein [Alistipes sp.]
APEKLSPKLRFGSICCENNVVCDNRKTARAVVCKQAYTTALSIFTILADSCYSRKQVKNGVLHAS